MNRSINICISLFAICVVLVFTRMQSHAQTNDTCSKTREMVASTVPEVVGDAEAFKRYLSPGKLSYIANHFDIEAVRSAVGADWNLDRWRRCWNKRRPVCELQGGDSSYLSANLGDGAIHFIHPDRFPEEPEGS